LITNSEYTGAYLKLNITTTSNQETSPEGVDNATEIKTTSTGQCHSSVAFTAATKNYVGSVFVKKQDFDYIYMEMGGAYAWFNINTGVLGNGSAYGSDWTYVDHSIEDYGNGWYRCVLVGNCVTAGAYTFRSVQPVPSNGTYDSGLAGGVTYWYGAQIELGSYPTSYIPTYNSSVTRSDDSCLATSVSDVIGQTQGTMFFEIDQPYADGVKGAWSISDGSSTNRLTMNTLDVNTTTFTLSIATNYAGGSTKLASVNKTYGLHKVAIQYSGTTLKLFVDGALADSVTTDGFGNYTNFYIGANQAGVGDEIREFKQAVLFPTALTDDECIALTTI